MASTVDLTKEETLTLETSSPSKRKLSPLEESKTMQSPTKIAKLESPLKDSNGTNSDSVPAETTVLKLQFAKLSDKAHPLVKGSNDADGFELRSASDFVVPKGGSYVILTDLKIKVPKGICGFVAPRSGLALKDNIDVGARVIRQDTGGNIGVVLFNHGDEDFKVSAGDPIAQLICGKIEYPEVEEVKALDETECALSS